VTLERRDGEWLDIGAPMNYRKRGKKERARRAVVADEVRKLVQSAKNPAHATAAN
jgi:hypothetical protein